MTKLEFVNALRARLIEEGFNEDYVNSHCSKLTEKLSPLTDEAAAGYTTEENLDGFVRQMIIQESGHRKVKSTQSVRTSDDLRSDTDTSQSVYTDIKSDAKEVEPLEDVKDAKDAIWDANDDLTPMETSRTSSKPSNTSVRTGVEIVNDPSRSSRRRSAGSSPSEYIPCDKPRLLTFLLALICAPTILLILGTAFGLFGGIFLALAASIFVIVLAIIAIVGVGSVLSVGALLYGATQMLSTPRYVGFHEIGFGLLVAGITMASAILLYNAAIRLVPFLYTKMGKLVKWFARKIVEFAKNAVKGCEQL